MPYSLTRALLASDEEGYKRATQSEFLRAAAQGRLSRDVLGQWLANDKLYIHSYIHGLGRFLASLDLPDTEPAPESEPAPTTKLVDWIVDALVNIRREEKFFVSTAAQYGIIVNLEAQADGKVAEATKLEGLRRWEALFGSVAASSNTTNLPWLEAAVVYWGTEICYLKAWTWAKEQLRPNADASKDADGGAVRKEFIGNWTSDEFVAFVNQLGAIIDEAVQGQGEQGKKELYERALDNWKGVLLAEEAFWPKL